MEHMKECQKKKTNDEYIKYLEFLIQNPQFQKTYLWELLLKNKTHSDLGIVTEDQIPEPVPVLADNREISIDDFSVSRKAFCDHCKQPIEDEPRTYTTCQHIFHEDHSYEFCRICYEPTRTGLDCVLCGKAISDEEDIAFLDCACIMWKGHVIKAVKEQGRQANCPQWQTPMTEECLVNALGRREYDELVGNRSQMQCIYWNEYKDMPDLVFPDCGHWQWKEHMRDKMTRNLENGIQMPDITWIMESCTFMFTRQKLSEIFGDQFIDILDIESPSPAIQSKPERIVQCPFWKHQNQIYLVDPSYAGKKGVVPPVSMEGLLPEETKCSKAKCPQCGIVYDGSQPCPKCGPKSEQPNVFEIRCKHCNLLFCDLWKNKAHKGVTCENAAIMRLYGNIRDRK